ncbi:hypothetical protein ASPBRDRAFT_37939 [Aspergillus brasiliensis CBS 101740]|uniref:RING-type domain-containing protein n=1 Tax=Aspergillus brasiliensis (strain CBS 101740 / IMI 381727 / IBT 21946) TaxID=767769 RepID=A0A1L9UVA3_ASPBC|nr:hypothetical protein ASPBRDRAFT_37939 [Aspergillus brasiliensis CBS 101740]
MESLIDESSVNIGQDGRAVVENYTGGQDYEHLSAEQLSLSDWISKPKQSARNARGHRMSMSITEVAPGDGVAVTGAAQEDNRALTNEMAALRLGDQLQLAQQQRMLHLSDGLRRSADCRREISWFAAEQARPQTLNDSRGSCMAESSRDAKNRHYADSLLFECFACAVLSPKRDTFEAPCSHRYCRRCTTKLLEDPFGEGPLFPPCYCPMPISFASIFGFLRN